MLTILRTSAVLVMLAVVVVLVMAAILIPRTAHANGFFIEEIDAAGVGQAGAITGGTETPSMLWWNPAHLVNLSGLRIMAGNTFFVGINSFKGAHSGVTTDAETGFHNVPYFFASYKFYKYMALGFGEYTSYGLSLKWPKGWEGANQVQEAGIETFSLSPSLSFSLPWVEGLSFGVNYKAILGKAYLHKGLQFVDHDGASKIGASTWVHSFDVAARYQPHKMVSLGFVYHHGAKLDVSNANLDFTVPDEMEYLFPDQKVHAKISLPSVMTGGVRVMPTEKLSLGLDFVWVFWDQYKRLYFDLSKDRPQTEINMVKNWEGACQLRIGVEYAITENWLVRGGFIWDQNPIPDETLDPAMPDNDRLDFTVGVGYRIAGFNVDFHYMAVVVLPREVKESSGNPLPGTYNSMVHNIGLSLGYHFDLPMLGQ